MSIASRYGLSSVICEPMWQSMPTTSRFGSAAAARYVARVVERDTELVCLQPRRDVRMRLRVDVRIHPQRHGRALAERCRDGVQPVELRDRFDVEALHACFECDAHFVGALADAREHDVPRAAARREHARELAARHDVEARAETREHVQHAEVAVRLHGDVNRRAAAGAGFRVGLVGRGERGARIDEERGAETLGELDGAHALGVERAVDVVECSLSHAGSVIGRRKRRTRARPSACVASTGRATA